MGAVTQWCFLNQTSNGKKNSLGIGKPELYSQDNSSLCSLSNCFVAFNTVNSLLTLRLCYKVDSLPSSLAFSFLPPSKLLFVFV